LIIWNFSTLPDTLFFAIFFWGLCHIFDEKNYGEIRIWGSDLVSKLSANEVGYFKFTVPIIKIDVFVFETCAFMEITVRGYPLYQVIKNENIPRSAIQIHLS
jgi:hypothetical protein